MTADAAPVSPETDALLCDVMLGKLAVYLRMCGYDTAYVEDRDAEAEKALRRRAADDGRRLLSRDAALIARTDDGVLLTERDVADQLGELGTAGFALALADPPTRCGRCNGSLEPVPDDANRPDYAPTTAEVPDCWRCRACGQHFWRGSHWDRVAGVIERVGGQASDPPGRAEGTGRGSASRETDSQ